MNLEPLPGDCICVTAGPDMDGPDEFCPQHGRWERMRSAQGTAAHLVERGQTDPVCGFRGKALVEAEPWMATCRACGGGIGVWTAPNYGINTDGVVLLFIIGPGRTRYRTLHMLPEADAYVAALCGTQPGAESRWGQYSGTRELPICRKCVAARHG